MTASLYLHVRERWDDAGLAWTGTSAGFSVAAVPVPSTEDDYLRRLGAALRASRKLRGMTQEQLADKLTMDKNSISRWERGETSLSAYSLALLWEALKVPAKWLLEPTDSFSELDRRIAMLRRAAAEAAQADEEDESGQPGDDGPDVPRGRR